MPMNADRRRAGRATRRRRSALAALVAAALATGLVGCSLGGTGPTQSTRSSAAAAAAVDPATSAGDGSSVASVVARADRTHEVPTPAGRESVVGGWRNPTDAVYVFATQYINWNSQDVSTRMRALASVSVGQARSAVSAAASETASDDELRQGQVANTGVVEAIAPVIGHRYEYAVATREQTTASGTDAYQGIAPQWHLAVATVTRLAGGLWVLSDWQPEN
ncbi:MAG: hypothetical protein WAL22_15545 [Solirubrobacteraceae bacterium]